MLGMGITSSVWAASCNDLEIFVPPAWTIENNQIGCDHGKVVTKWKSGNPLVIGSVSGGLYGPTCNVFIYGPKGQYSVVKFDQKLCVAEGGTITVTPLKGDIPDFVPTEGSFKPAMAGKVSILRFKPKK